jgi:hypothetical protein
MYPDSPTWWDGVTHKKREKKKKEQMSDVMGFHGVAVSSLLKKTKSEQKPINKR